MEANKDAQTDSIRSMIVALVRATWNEKRVGVLLSQIGSLVSGHPELARAEMGSRKLTSYLEEELQDELRIFVSPDNPIVRVAIPAEVGVAGDPVLLFPHADPTKKAAAATGVSGAILTAFSRPLAADKQRVVHLTPKVRFDDIDLDAEIPASAKPIARDLIVDPSGVADPAQATAQLIANIKEWRAQSELEPGTISPKPRVSERPGRKSLLEQIIETLSEQDLKRVQLPLDIVEKLLNRF
ncbi:hypothetical protein PQR14_03670 [Paraburkholderia bryophila]|uniref:hypothetical protein n=1 Tax=Burkholderiaceae TaxID=119060 RepID=UPI00054F6100|nr:hypothetical protein [Burkholderia sp. 9120]